jgi:carbamoyltransferase
VEHHLAHAVAYLTAPWGADGGPTLALTCDWSGDRVSATVSVGEKGSLTRLAEISEHDSLGRLYALVIRHLGMITPEHEYKVMGMAPYAACGACAGYR